jgi:uncharacterized protein (DUF433 family)
MANMAADTVVDIGSLIVSREGVCGGRPCLAGTRVRAMVIGAAYAAGMTPEAMLEEFPTATLSKIHAGIAYYLANRERLDAEIAEERLLEQKLMRGYRGPDA